jgi:hypothetical protein
MAYIETWLAFIRAAVASELPWLGKAPKSFIRPSRPEQALVLSSTANMKTDLTRARYRLLRK